MDASAGTRQRAALSDYLAAERTLLAWIRRGLALIGFGFVVARFGLFLQQLQVMQRASAAQSYGLSLWFGTALITLGVVVNLSLSLASPSAGPRVGPERACAFSSVDSGCVDCFVPGFSWTCSGDLPGFRSRLYESSSRK